MALLAPQAAFEPSLREWANNHLGYPYLPEWVLPLLLISDEIRYFDLVHVLTKVFSHRQLNGTATKPVDFAVHGSQALDETVHVPLHRADLFRLWSYAVHVAQVTDLPDWQKIDKRNLVDHPWVSEYRKYLTGRGRNKKYIYSAASVANQLFRIWLPALAKYQGQDWTAIKLYSLTYSDVRILLNSMRRKVATDQLSESTASRISVQTLSFLRYCGERFGIPDVTANLKGLPQHANLDFWLPDHQHMAEFFEIAQTYAPNKLRDVALFASMYLQGLRPEEARQMRWDGVDLDSNVLTFLAKGGHYDQVSLVSSLSHLLAKLRNETLDKTEFVFTQGRRVLSGDRMRMLFRTYAKIAGWPDGTSVRIFRHAFCTHLLRDTGDYNVVNRLARHNTFDMTERYLHLAQIEYLQTAHKLQKSLGLNLRKS